LSSTFFPRERAERLIAAARFLIAVASSLAVALGSGPFGLWSLRPVVIGFALYASLIALIIEAGAILDSKCALAMHALDLAFFASFAQATDGPAFFVCFSYALLAAALRWDWRGVLWTGAAAAALSVLLGIGAPGRHALLMRVIYIAVLASIIAMLKIDEERRRDDLKRLSAWTIAPTSDRTGLLANALGFAAEVLRAPRILVAWEDPDEPWLHLGFFDGAVSETREPAGTFDSALVAGGLARAAFACADVTGPEPTLTDLGGVLHRWRGEPIHSALARRYGMRSVVSAPFAFDELEGRIFALDGRSCGSDDLVLARAAVMGVAAGLRAIARWEQIGLENATRERLRLARELHDGVLQFLAGTALQIESVRQLLDGRAPESASNRLDEIGRWIKEEQQELRFFVGELRPGGGLGREDTPGEGFRNLAERVARHWEIEIEFEAAGLPPLPRGLFAEIARLIQEAIVNAARHARASRVRVAIGLVGPTIRIMVDDNGRGFSFAGKWSLEALNRQKLGPVSLKERVTALGGSLTIASRESGSLLDITVPWERPAGDAA
jgi:signal transduction histidine kinase